MDLAGLQDLQYLLGHKVHLVVEQQKPLFVKVMLMMQLKLLIIMGLPGPEETLQVMDITMVVPVVRLQME